MDHARIQRVDDFLEPATGGERHHSRAAPRKPPAVSARASRIQQCQAHDALRCLAHDLERDVAAHRQADQREARWCIGQDATGDAGHGVIAGVVGDHHPAAAPERSDLPRVHARGEQQAGDHHDGQRLGHGREVNMRRMKVRTALAAAVLLPVLAAAAAPPARVASAADTRALSVDAAGRFAALALKCLHQEYPNHISHTLARDADARPPRELTPAFYGCFDWHSDVHGHWLLVRLLRLFPQAPFAAQARSRAGTQLHRGEHRRRGCLPAGRGTRLVRASLRPGVAAASWPRSCAAGTTRTVGAWAATLAPLEAEAAARIKGWVPKLHYPIRIGEHDQTAFSFGLIWDWAGVAQDEPMRAVLRDAAQRFYQRGPQLPARLRALRAGLPLALPGGGGLHAPRAGAGGLSRTGSPASCRAFPRTPTASPWLAPGVVDRSRRPEAGAHRRPEPEPRLDARGHRRGAACRGCAARRTAGRRAGPPRRRTARRSPASTTRAATGSAPSRCTSPVARACRPSSSPEPGLAERFLQLGDQVMRRPRRPPTAGSARR